MASLVIVFVAIFFSKCLKFILRKYEHNNNKSKHSTFKKSKIGEVAENSANTGGGKIQSQRMGKSHRDTFRPCSRVSSGSRTSSETKKSLFQQERKSLVGVLIYLR